MGWKKNVVNRGSEAGAAIGQRRWDLSVAEHRKNGWPLERMLREQNKVPQCGQVGGGLLEQSISGHEMGAAGEMTTPIGRPE
jgi:hypothetical protein